MSPQQALGLAVDRRSDIFFAAVVVHELSSGHRLFLRGSENETRKAVIDVDAPDLFMDPQAIASYLMEHGVSLSGPRAEPLTRPPACLRYATQKRDVQRPVVLPLGDALPVLLLLSMRSGTLLIQMEQREDDELRLGLYHDAHKPATRGESLTIAPLGPWSRFDLGHRRREVHTVHYMSTAPGIGKSKLRVRVPQAGIELVPDGKPKQFAVLHTTDPRTSKIKIHLLGVSVY